MPTTEADWMEPFRKSLADQPLWVQAIADASVAAERERIVREVEGMGEFCGEHGWTHDVGDCPAVERSAVLAIVRGEQP